MHDPREPLDWESLDNATSDEVEAFFRVVEQRMKDAVSRAIAETDSLQRSKAVETRRAS